MAALGGGLGFGLQEIFANFISGLIILFEKADSYRRYGDHSRSHRQRDQNQYRATTIADWDREIIVPNKAFIREQFTSTGRCLTPLRVVLTIPAPAVPIAKKVTQILLTAARRFVL